MLGSSIKARGHRYNRSPAMKKLVGIPRIIEVTVRPPYGLIIKFDDGLVREVDLSNELWGPMFEPLKDPSVFAKVRVDHGTVVWPNGMDLDPVVLHGDAEPTKAEPEAR